VTYHFDKHADSSVSTAIVSVANISEKRVHETF